MAPIGMKAYTAACESISTRCIDRDGFAPSDFLCVIAGQTDDPPAQSGRIIEEEFKNHPEKYQCIVIKFRTLGSGGRYRSGGIRPTANLRDLKKRIIKKQYRSSSFRPSPPLLVRAFFPA